MDNFTLLGSSTLPGFSLGTWYTLALRANGSAISVEVNGSTVIGPVTDSAFTSGNTGVWSYQPAGAGSHRFDNFSVTVIGGGQPPAGKVLARRVLPQNAPTPAPNQVYRLYYYAGARRVAVRVWTGATGANDLYFLHSDHLGSTTVTTDLSQNIVGQQRYYAYGEPRNTSGTLHTDRRFTGQREETGLGSLYDYNARYYSPLSGRFISADTIVPEPGNPQALNRYAYGLNNPLKYTDPSGHWPEWFDYGLGVGYQFVNDMAFGIPNAVLGTGWQDEQSYAFQSGQRLGRDVSVALNVALAVDGTVKLAAGIAAMGPTAGGGALCGAAPGGVCLIPAGGALAAEAGLAGVGAVEGLVGGANLITIKNNPLQGSRYTASNFRKNLENRTPIPKGMKNPEAHHMLPQALEARFNKLGINIHDPRWGAWWAKADHAKYWYRYNWDWERWFADFARRSATPTLQEVEQQAAFMARQYGLTWP